MHQIHHVKALKCNKTEVGPIEPTSKKHRNIEKVRFGSIELIRLNSVRFDIPGKF
jgi:hypothetical protein